MEEVLSVILNTIYFRRELWPQSTFNRKHAPHFADQIKWCWIIQLFQDNILDNITKYGNKIIRVIWLELEKLMVLKFLYCLLNYSTVLMIQGQHRNKNNYDTIKFMYNMFLFVCSVILGIYNQSNMVGHNLPDNLPEV